LGLLPRSVPLGMHGLAAATEDGEYLRA